MSVLRSRLRARVVVTLKSGDAFDGVLFEMDRHAWVLRNVTALDSERPVPLDGEVVVLTPDIAYVQRP